MSITVSMMRAEATSYFAMQTREWLDRHRAERSGVGSEYGRPYAEQSDRSAFFAKTTREIYRTKPM
jgi:hypothetical protein